MKQYLLKLSVLVAIVATGLSASAGNKIYLLKSSAWSTTAIWAWVDNGPNYTGGNWPGQKMSVENIEGTDYFYWEVPDNAPDKINIIFNNNVKDNGSQTGDITNVDVTENVYYKLNSAKNNVEKLKSPLILDNPAISVERNVVTIKASADGGDVYYTLDGTEPTNESAKYTGPFTITEDVTVKAIQMKTVARSEVVSLAVAWKYYCDTEVPAGIYYAADAPVEVCCSDTWLPVEGGTKASGQPDALYLVGNIAGHNWDVSYKCEGKRYGTYFVFDDVELALAEGETLCFFTFVTKLGGSWNDVNGSNRYGATSKDETIVLDTAKKYRIFTPSGSNDNHASAANSWKVAQGTYRFEVDFAAGTVLVTQKPAPAFVAMAEADTEAAGFKAEGKTLYKADVTGAKVAFRSGEAVSSVFTPDAAKAYIYTAAALEEVVPVSVGLTGAADGLMTDSARLIASDGTVSARYSAGEGDDAIADELQDGEAMLNPSLFAPNALVELAWEATSTQGLTFCGKHSLVTPGEEVRIYAKVPEGWSNLSYSMVSDVNEAHTAEGVFSEVAGDYLVVTVPAHLIYSQVTFYDGAPVSRAAGDSVTYPLAGKTMYFEDNGKFWNENTLDYITGVEAVEAADNAEVEYFNLQGVRVAAPSAGVYIRRCGTKVSKVFIAE